MDLLTPEIIERLPPIGATENIPMASKVAVCKFFFPFGVGTWYVCEGSELPNGDWEFFGYADLGCPEWGYFYLSELESISSPLGGVERDLWFEDENIAQVTGW